MKFENFFCVRALLPSIWWKHLAAASCDLDLHSPAYTPSIPSELLNPVCRHCSTVVSFPSQLTLVNHKGPSTCPYLAPVISKPSSNPSLRQKTFASLESQSQSQMPPHWPLYFISTLPRSVRPSAPPSRKSIPASKKYTFLVTKWWFNTFLESLYAEMYLLPYAPVKNTDHLVRLSSLIRVFAGRIWTRCHSHRNTNTQKTLTNCLDA